jgi:molybdopterin converting factor subunit 1
MPRLEIKYYAVLREKAGRNAETLVTGATTPAAVYDELRERHGFKLGREVVRVAVNDEFAEWNTALRDGDELVFIPPVAGG